MTAVTPSKTRVSARRWRRAAFPLAAICIGLSPFLLFESVLRVGGWGRVSDGVDPFIGFDAVHPLFTLNARGDRYEIPESRQTFFRPESFAAPKPDDGFRVFCLGGSTVQGRPYAIETAFAKWLELSLECADPSRTWEVVNCGGVSYASYRLAPMLRELLAREPDLFILYTGHNEFLEDRTYRDIKTAAPWVVRMHRAMTSLRTYNLLRSAWVRANGHDVDPVPDDLARLRTEVDAVLDYRGGLEEYRRDPVRRRSIVRHYEFNLRRMIHMADAAGVPVILVNPASNLRDSPPFKTLHRDDITFEEGDRFETLWNQSESLDITVNERIAILKRALAIDDCHARAYFELGACYEQNRDYDLARASYLRALDEDVCPLRMLPAMHDVVLRVVAQTPATLVDARRLFGRLAAHGIPGATWFVDHVHPTIKGHQRIAALLLEEMERRGFVRPVGDWIARRDARYRRQFQALPPDYHLQGRRRLNGLRRWSGGQGIGERRGSK